MRNNVCNAMPASDAPCGVKTSRRRFTLIELLVVVAMIMTLMALLLPALQNAKGMAKRSACASNLRQIAICAISYAADSNDVLPSHHHSAGGMEWTSFFSSYPNGGRQYLYPNYIQNWKALYCPCHPMWCPNHKTLEAEAKSTVCIGYNTLRGQAYFTYKTSDHPLLSLKDCRQSRALYMDFTAQLPIDTTSNGYIDARFNGHEAGAGNLRGANVAFSNGAVVWHSLDKLKKHSNGGLASMFLWPPDPASGYDY